MAGVESAVSFAVDSLANLLAQELRLLSGVRGKVEWVETELRRIECFLKDTDSSSSEGNERMKNWRRELRELVTSAEDAVDMFILRVEPLRRRVFCLGQLKRYVFIHKEFVARHKVASKIAGIKLKLSSLSDSRNTYGIEFIGQGADAAGSAGRRIFQEHMLSSPSIPVETDFVGFGNELEEFITRLTSEEPKRLCIFSVVGMDSLGKTTFASKVYSDSRVKEHFEERAWVSVSQQYAVTDIYTALLRRFNQLSEQERQKERNMDQLKDDILRHLKEKKYLIVLDDVWTKKAWDDLTVVLPDSKNGSRVLLTSRNPELASHVDPQIKPHELRVLNRDESWELFCKKTFPEHKNCFLVDDAKKKIGRKIVEKCEGLPLAIVAVGGMLAGKSMTEWEQVLKSISWRFGYQGEAITSGILKLSYEDLPYDLKPCFLYLGIFPEHKEFRAKELIHMWAAERLLQERGNKTVEEVGEDFVRALVQRSMIQVAKTSSTGGIKSCRIHDLVRNIAISEAKVDKFLQVQRRSNNIALSSSVKSRRLAIHGNEASINECISSNSSHLRSMFIYGQDWANLEEERHKSLCSRYKLLRVLYLHNVTIDELPSGIGDLIHLRFFGCAGWPRLRSLPQSIRNLRSLRTLTIDSVFPIEIPCAIQILQELRHLRVKCSFFIASGRCSHFDGQPRLEQITNLHTLTHVKAGEWVHNSLGKLNSLRKLGITLDSDAYDSAYYQSIAQLESLQSLSLASPTFNFSFEDEPTKVPNVVPLAHLLQLRKLSLWGKLVKLPQQSEFPPNLTKLTLSYSHLDQEAVATLEKLQNLRILRLLRSSYVGEGMNCSIEGFPSLQYLRLEGLPNLDKWIMEEGAMRELEHLTIAHAEN